MRSRKFKKRTVFRGGKKKTYVNLNSLLAQTATLSFVNKEPNLRMNQNNFIF